MLVHVCAVVARRSLELHPAVVRDKQHLDDLRRRPEVLIAHPSRDISRGEDHVEFRFNV